MISIYPKNPIDPEASYSISEAAEFLGVSRMALYRYIRSSSSPLPYSRPKGKFRIEIKGADLIAFKSSGLPKSGRRRMTKSHEN